MDRGTEARAKMNMDVVRAKAERAVAHIGNAGERAKRYKTMLRIYMNVELEPEEALKQDDGSLDGVPIADINLLDTKEDQRLAGLMKNRTEIFELEEEQPETEEQRLNKQGKFGYTQLHQAVVDQNYPFIEVLLSKGINYTIKDRGGATAYAKAFRMGDQTALTIFHKRGIQS